MGILDWVVGRVGSVDPRTGERVRIRARASDDWGNTHDVVERKDNATGEWKEGPTVPGSGTNRGGHYT